MCFLCGWRMGKLVAFMSIVAPTELGGLFQCITHKIGDPGSDENVGSTHLSASVIKIAAILAAP